MDLIITMCDIRVALHLSEGDLQKKNMYKLVKYIYIYIYTKLSYCDYSNKKKKILYKIWYKISTFLFIFLFFIYM